MMLFKKMNKAFVARRMKDLSREHYMRERSIDYWTLWALVLLIGGGTHHCLWMLISSQSLFQAFRLHLGSALLV